MSFRDLPIRRKLAAVLLAVSALMLLITCTTFIVYELRTFRQGMVKNIATLGQVIATNSTAALAFDNAEDAAEVLSALQADPHVTAAGLFDRSGRLFARYPKALAPSALPAAPEAEGFRFERGRLVAVLPIKQGDNRQLGSLYLESDLEALYGRLRLYGEITAVTVSLSLLLAFVLARFLQEQIAHPILRLAQAARAVSEDGDYSVHVEKISGDEVGRLTDAFNQMLGEIQRQHLELADSAARVRAVLDSALSAAIVIDAGGRVIDWNTRAEDMFGWSRDDALGQDLADMIIPPALRHAHRRGIQHFTATGEAPMLNRLFETTAQRRSGAGFPAELSISRLKSGDQVSFCGFVTDITERKQAESRVRAQLDRLHLLNRITRAIGERQDLASIFQVLIRSLEDSLAIDFGAVCLYEAESRLLTVTSLGMRGAALSGELELAKGAQIAVGANGLSRCVLGELVYEPDIGAAELPFTRRLAGSGLRSLVLAPLAVESKVFGVLIAARRVAQGFSSADCEFLRQLSEHAGLATHQAQLYGALQQAYDDLRQTQQAILQQERLRVLGQMASGIAHDINNAISPVALYTESLLEKEKNLSATARRQLETIQRAVDDVAQTVLRMREFYRQRDTELALAPVQLNQLVAQVVDLTRARWCDIPQQRGIVIEMKLELAPQLPTFMGVESEIREALTNLIFNAVDAMPESGTLTIRTGVTAEAPPRVHIDVIDSGVGMDEDTRRRCLEPFFTTKGERGTGLGLAMVYGMIKRHSADIEVDSAPGRGTRMRLLFMTAPQVEGHGDGAAAVTPLQHRLRILIVDDDPLVINSLRETLEGDGHAVTAADGGQKGIDAFLAAQRKHEPYTVVITDLGMPYVDGRKVSAAIKAASPDTPVIMLTGWGQRLIADKEVPPHVDRVLNKPPKLQALREALLECAAPAAAREPMR